MDGVARDAEETLSKTTRLTKDEMSFSYSFAIDIPPRIR